MLMVFRMRRELMIDSNFVASISELLMSLLIILKFTYLTAFVNILSDLRLSNVIFFTFSVSNCEESDKNTVFYEFISS